MTSLDVSKLPGSSAVAVVITCFNEGSYIGAAVRSVLAQTRADLIDAIVIADDGSEADTVAILKDIERWDPRIRIIYGRGGAGLPAQRNLAIRCTHAPLIALLDGDDVWTPDKLELQVPMLLSNLDVGLAYAGYSTFAADDLVGAHRARVRDITAETDLTRAFFLCDPPIIPSTTLIRRSAFEACGGFDPTIRVFEDTDFYLRMSRLCRFAFIEAPLLYKRSHPSSITGGRKDLMAYHALVALKAAADDPSLLSLVPRRLAERARKLGNYHFLMGENARARPLLRFAVRLHPCNVRAWASLAVSVCVPHVAHVLMASRWKSRRAALGAIDSAACRPKPKPGAIGNV
jgi:glycosyltransferase involved in cell wall biosynthesis